MDDAAQYGEEILLLIEQAIDGELNREEFEQMLRRRVYFSLELAFRRGAKLTATEQLLPHERIALEKALTNHEESIIRMTNELYTAIELERAARRSQ